MSTDPLLGCEVGDYRVIDTLGRGGMGVVYLAEDLALRRKVALKVLAPGMLNDATARARFQREIDSSVAIEHPHIVPVYNAGYDGSNFFIVMRYVEGNDLAAIRRSVGRLPERRATRLLGQIASALHAVHLRGLVHRDVKPHNVLVWNAGAPDEHALLTDFGIAKALDDTSTITRGGPIGTPAYMAPEVCLGRTVTPAADQYSYACLAYELLSGRRPFDADGIDAQEAHINEAPQRLTEHIEGASAEVTDALDRALEKEPRDRFADMAALAVAMDLTRESFSRAKEIDEVVAETGEPEQLVSKLSRDYGMSDGRIAEITDSDRSKIMQLKRRAARRTLVGQRSRLPRSP